MEIREVNLGFRVPGRILEVQVEGGDPVESGKLLWWLSEHEQLPPGIRQAIEESTFANYDVELI